jgi:RNA recognition motif-containing protein
MNSKGQPVSKGFGFVEFDDEQSALRAIRRIVDPSAPMLLCGRRPMVEFSVENIQVVRLKKIRSDRLKASCSSSKRAADVAAPAEPPAKKRYLTPKERRLEQSQPAAAAAQPSKKRGADASAALPPARRRK